MQADELSIQARISHFIVIMYDIMLVHILLHCGVQSQAHLSIILWHVTSVLALHACFNDTREVLL